MKKIVAVILSCTLIFSVGTTSALAETGSGALSLFTGSYLSETAEISESEGSGTEDQEMIYEPEDSGDIESRPETSDEDLTEESPAGDEDPENPDSGETDGEYETEDGREGDDTDRQEPLTDEQEAEDGEEVEEEDVEEEEEEAEEAEEIKTLALRTYSVDDYVDLKEIGSISLKYDDRYDLSTLSDEISSGDSYTLFMEESDGAQNIKSYQVINGKVSSELDETLLAQKTEGSTSVIASGVGSADFYIILTEDYEKLKELEEENGDSDTVEPVSVGPAAVEVYTDDSDAESSPEGDSIDGSADSGSSDTIESDGEILNLVDAGGDILELGISEEDMVDVYKLSVTVEAAPLTLMFLMGQSNMEGYCSSSTGYETSASVACTDGTVYSTYTPSSTGKGTEVTGLTFGSDEAGTSASGSLVTAGSLQGAVSASDTSEDSSYVISGTLKDPLNISGSALTYPLNSLTESGGGKTGPDSGLAWKWNELTGDKVWVINTAYGSTSISGWESGGTYMTRSVSIWEDVLKTYNAEIAAGHYTSGSVSGNKLVFWLQGETGDATSSPDKYESSFDSMYSSVCGELGSNVPFGIIMVRAGKATDSPATEADLYMTGPRIAQYFLGGSNSSYGNVFVVSNANEQWVTNSGVASYFSSSSSSGLNYPMQGASKSLPTTVGEVHSDIHYSQVGHNENGITAAYGMWGALGFGGSSGSLAVTWKDEDYNAITSLSLEYASDYATVVPVVDPVYLAKRVSFEISGDSVSYVFSTGTVTGASSLSYGTSKITPSGASGTLTVNIEAAADLSSIAGKDYTGLYKYNGVWWYLKNGIIDKDYVGLVKNENGWWYVSNGKLDRSYTGFAVNENGSWYVTNGKLTRNDNSVLKDTEGVLGTAGEWYYVIGSKVQDNFTGLADYSNSSGWWYITKGRVDRSVTTVAKNKNGWWYVANGKVDKSYTGFATNENGFWYMENGKLLRDQNTVIKDTKGALGSKNDWYYVIGSKVQKSFTGLANYKNSSGWWYITKGKVDRSVNTVAKNKNGWYYVVNGKVQKSFNGLANYRNASGWWYIKSGKVDRTFTGIAKNKNGTYYLKNGKVQQSYTGSVKISGKTYKIKNGKVQ